MGEKEKAVGAGISSSLIRLVVWIALYIVVGAAVFGYILPALARVGVNVEPYTPYVSIVLALVFGYMIVMEISKVAYWNMRLRYDHPQAAAVRNVVRILGVGALAAAVAGSVGGGASGVALGGFIGIVVGFATQQILGQAVAGLFVLLARPFRIGDKVAVAGEEGVVEDIMALFTVIDKGDTKVLIPNNMLVGSKITVHRQKTQSG